MNIKIRSLEGDTVFLLPALTRLVRLALFPCLSHDRLFLIFAWIYSTSSFDPERRSVKLVCILHFPCRGSPESSSSISSQFRPGLVRAGAECCVRACCSSESRAEQAAQGTATCLKHMVMQATASRESQCEEQLWYQPAQRFSWSFPCCHVGDQRSGNSQLLLVLEIEAVDSKGRGSHSP